MKYHTHFICFALYFLYANASFAQNTLIPNANFNSGFQGIDKCEYDNYNIQKFDEHIDYWENAYHKFGKDNETAKWIDPKYIFKDCLVKFIGDYCKSFTIVKYPVDSSRFVIVETAFYKEYNNGNKKYKHGAIINSLSLNNYALVPGKKYNFRMKAKPLIHPHYPYYYQYSGYNHLKVYFTTWKDGWWKEVNKNSIWQPITISEYLDNDSLICEWKNYQFEITVPTNTFSNNLYNITLFALEGGFAIDDIELYEKCPTSMVIQDRTFDNYFYSSTFQNGQTFVYEAAQYLYAGNGNWQNTPELIIEKGADIIFTAGEAIVLLPGFTAENNFDAYITPCGGGNRMAADTNQSSNQYFVNENADEDMFFEPYIFVYPNPSTGIFTIKSEEAINPQQIEVYDVFGKRVQPIINPNGTGAIINLENHSKGIYLVRIGIFKQKIVLE